MMYSEKRCLEIYRVAREKNLFYAAHQRDHDSYELVSIKTTKKRTGMNLRFLQNSLPIFWKSGVLRQNLHGPEKITA